MNLTNTELLDSLTTDGNMCEIIYINNVDDAGTTHGNIENSDEYRNVFNMNDDCIMV